MAEAKGFKDRLTGTTYDLKDATAREGVATNAAAIEALAATVPAVDDDLDTAGAAADAKATGSKLSDVKSAISFVKNGYVETWERGSITTDTGVDTSSTNRCRSVGYISFLFSGAVSFHVKSGDKVSYREYTNTSGGFVAKTYDWKTSDFTLNVDATHFYRFVIAKADDSTTTLATFDNSDFSFERCVVTDGTLSVQGKAADAKAVGDTFGMLALEKTVYLNTWDQGTLGETGIPSNSDTRCRTSYLLIGTNTQKIKLTVPNGKKISYREYSSTNYTDFVSTSKWFVESTEIQVNAGHYYRFVIAFVDNANIVPSDIASGSALYVETAFADETLTIHGKAADAAAVGQKIKETAEEFEDILGMNTNLSFAQGSLTTSDGEYQASSTRIHTGLIEYHNPMEITLGAGFKYSYRTFSVSGAYIDASDWITLGGKLELPSTVGFVRFVVAYISNDAITPEDEIVFSVDRQNDVFGSFENSYSGNMRGNVSIRAAKTINFSDGTPPIADWYLLQTPANEFYMSKDLRSKKYLFSFIPPSGKVGDWSVGITANNDIVFCADAAGLDDSVNGRLSDANRLNPVCYLAAENYAIQHTIDFGENIPPCGWLGNVGWCMLPNGNVVMCEYTRGTVKTANVWLISGDVSDPDNWTITWSTNIIDTTDTTTAGIKHCHEAQYDFYTGVVYFGTGDSDEGSYNYYSTDNGETWTLLYGPDKDKCRRLTYVFTPDKVYWASDSYESAYHHFFIADRDENGLVDVENATSVSLTSDNTQACYGCVYLQSINCVVMMDRTDGEKMKMDWYAYDIDSATIKKIGEFKSADDTARYLGFRTKYVDWYPNGNGILVGFNPSRTSINADTNANAICGNGGGTTGNGGTRINNVTLYVYKNGSNLSYKADTLWI